MERYEIGWTPSPSANVDRHEIMVAEDGGAFTKKADAIASAVTAEIRVTTGASVKVYVHTIGDNLTVADCAVLEFESSDKTPVAPVSGLTATWKGHED